MHRTEEVKGVDFYAFSYYYDLAVNAGFIGKSRVGWAVRGPGLWVPRRGRAAASLSRE